MSVETAVREEVPVRSSTGTGSLWGQSLVEAGRLLRRWSRQPEVLTSTLALPVLLLLMFDLVLAKSLNVGGESDALNGFVPMIAMAGSMYGAMGTGESLFAERQGGLLRRFWVLPIHRSAGLIGRLIAECGRTLVATVVVLAIGFVLGMRFEQGLPGAVGAVLVPVIVVIGFAPLVITVGVSAVGDKVVQLFSIIVLVGMFFNSGFAPVQNYPGWLQPIVRGQPMSCAIEAMRGFIVGGPIATPLLQTVAWSVGLLAVFGALAVRGYRNAAES